MKSSSSDRVQGRWRRALARLAVLTVALAGPWAASSLAHADAAADMESAKELVKQGRELRDKGDHKAAIEKFKAAHKLVNTPVTALDLGKEHVALGELVEARAVLTEVERIPVKTNESAVAKKAREDAAKLADDLKARIAQIVFKLSGATTTTTFTVSVDGEAVPAEALSVPRKVNPRKHVVSLKVGDDVVSTQEVELQEGESKDVSFVVPEPKKPPPVEPPPLPKPAEPAVTPPAPPPIPPAVTMPATGPIDERERDGERDKHSPEIGLTALVRPTYETWLSGNVAGIGIGDVFSPAPGLEVDAGFRVGSVLFYGAWQRVRYGVGAKSPYAQLATVSSWGESFLGGARFATSRAMVAALFDLGIGYSTLHQEATDRSNGSASVAFPSVLFRAGVGASIRLRRWAALEPMIALTFARVSQLNANASSGGASFPTKDSVADPSTRIGFSVGLSATFDLPLSDD